MRGRCAQRFGHDSRNVPFPFQHLANALHTGERLRLAIAVEWPHVLSTRQQWAKSRCAEQLFAPNTRRAEARAVK